ncbi:hypothetical protein ACFLW0_04065 [Chloroflexota bacterium]
MLRTAICNFFGIEHPIVQGGMAHIAVAEAERIITGLNKFCKEDWLCPNQPR